MPHASLRKGHDLWLASKARSANKRRIGSDLPKLDAHVIQPHEYDEAPEWTEEDFALRPLPRHQADPPRAPPLERPKEAVKLRLSPDVLDHFRAGGPGWRPGSMPS